MRPTILYITAGASSRWRADPLICTQLLMIHLSWYNKLAATAAAKIKTQSAVRARAGR